MNPCELTAYVSALANIISLHLDTDELSLLAAILTQLGDTLATVAAYRNLAEDKKSAERETSPHV